jgi:hypothetical protein
VIVTCQTCGVGYEVGVEMCLHSLEQISGIAAEAASIGTPYPDLMPGVREVVGPVDYATSLDGYGFEAEAVRTAQ